jgi:hypothetical protein
VFEKRMLWRIFEPERKEVTGDWRKLHNEELHNLYPSPDIVRAIKAKRMRGAGHVVRMEEMTNSYKILSRRHEGKGPLRRTRRRWEDNIIMDLGEIRWEGVDWIHVAQDWDQRRTPVKMVMKFGFHKILRIFD